MKNILLLLTITIYSFFHSQTKIVNPDQFELNTGSDDISVGLHGDVKCMTKDGNDKDTEIIFEFMSTVSEFGKINYDKIDKMIILTRSELLGNLKNKYSFNPKKVTITFDNLRNSWAVIWEYVAKNFYGGEVVETQVFLYDNDLKKVKV